jgi:hypothetical protein
MEGCALALQFSDKPFVVEMDCAKAVVMIQSYVEDRSQFTYLVSEVRILLAERVRSKVEVFRQEQNSVSDALAKMVRLEHTTNLWRYTAPNDIPRFYNEDCNPGI